MKKQHEHKIDELFDKSFGDFKSEPSEQVWENVRRQIPPAADMVNYKKGFRFAKFSYWLIPSAVILTAAALYWYFNTNSGAISNSIQNKTEIVNNGKNTVADKNTIHENSEINSTTSSSVKKENTEKQNPPVINNNKMNEPVDNTDKYTQTNVLSGSNSAKNNKNSINGSKTEQNIVKEASSVNETQNISSIENKENNSENNFSNKEGNIVNSNTDQSFKSFDKLSKIEVPEIKYLKSNEKSSIYNGSQNAQVTQLVPDPVPFRLRIYFGIHYTPELMSNMPEYNSPVEPKKNNFAQSGQLSFNYDLRNIVFQTGVGYSFYNNKATNNINYISNDSIGYFYDVVSYNVVQGDSGQQIIYHTQVANIYDSVYHSDYDYSKNKYRYIQIPLLVGYKGYINKFSFSVRTGIGLGILSYKKEIPYSFNMDDASLISIVNTTPKLTKTYWQILFNIGIGYQLSDKITIAIEPSFKYYLSSFYENDNSKKHPYSIGLKTGFYFKF